MARKSLLRKLFWVGLVLTATNGFALNDVTLEEARTFLNIHLSKAFPGNTVTNDHLIKIDTFNSQEIICYGTECWAVRKDEGKIIDLASEIAKRIVPVRIEFMSINSPQSTARMKVLKEKEFAITLSDVDYVASILRFLDGYSFYAPYSIKFVAKKDVNALPAYKWSTFQYFKNSAWLDNSEVLANFANIGHLEEVYDGSLSMLGSFPGDRLKTSGYWRGRYAEISPWAVTIDAVIKDGDMVANLGDLNLLPEGPRLYKTEWIYP